MQYLLILFFVILCTYVDVFDENDKKKNLMYIFLCIVLIIFAGTRFETGSDWRAYTSAFKEVGTLNQLFNGTFTLGSMRMEHGYILLNSIIKSLGGSINEVFLIMALVTMGLIFISCKKYTPYYFVAILLYLRYGYPQTNFMFVRQGICIALFLYSIKYIYEKKLLKYYICITICVLFHKSSLILYPIYFIVNREYKSSILIGLMILSVILGFTNWIRLTTIFTPDKIDASINEYLNSGMSATLSIGMIEKIAVITIALLFREKLNKRFKYFNVFLNLYVISFMAYYSLIESYVLQQRMVIIFNIAGIILISYFIYLGNSKLIKVIICTMIVGVVTIFFVKSIGLFNEDSEYLPYKSYIPIYIENIKNNI